MLSRCANCHAEMVGNTNSCPHCGFNPNMGTQPIGSVGVPSPRRMVDTAPLSVPAGHDAVCPGCGFIAPSKREHCPHCDTTYGRSPLLVPRLTDQRFWVAARVTFTCHRCMHGTPLNRMDAQSAAPCLHCGLEEPIDANQWWGALAHAHAVGDLAGPHPEGRFRNKQVSVRHHNPFAELGVSRSSAVFDRADHEKLGHRSRRAPPEPHSLRLEAAPGHPLCRDCRAPLRPERVDGQQLVVRCTNSACGESQTFLLPSGIQDQAPYVLGAVAREHHQHCEPVRLKDDGRGGKVALCPGCSDKVDLNSFSTLVECKRCGRTSRVGSDVLRHAGFERPRTETIWLLLHGPSKLRARLERQRRRAQAKKKPAQRMHQRRDPVPVETPAPIQKPPSRRARVAVLLTGLLALAVVVSVAFVLYQRGGEPSAVGNVTLAAAALTEDGRRAEPSPQATNRPTDISFSLEWPAKVAHTRGKALKNGSRCQVAAKVVSGRLDWVTVKCGAETLYDRRQPLQGASTNHWQLFERTETDSSQWRYRLHYVDTGLRTGRTQVTLDTPAGRAAVFSEQAPKFRVELDIDADSTPRTGTTLFATPNRTAPLSSRLRVEETRDKAPTSVKKACELSANFLMAGERGTHCRARLSCSGETLYGAEKEHGSCRLEGGRIVQFSTDARNGDAPSVEFSFDLDTRTATLERGGDTPYRVDFSIE